MKNIYPYAGFWKRVGAAVIDSIILSIVGQIGNQFLALFFTIPQPTPQMSPLQFLSEYWPFYVLLMGFGIIVSILYFAIMESSSLQATVGKMALQIKVVDYNGQRLSFWHAFGRRMAKILTGWTFYIGYIMAGATRKKQALHDKIAHTYVVVKDFQPGAELPEVEPRWGVFWSVTGILALFWVLLVMSFVALFAVASRAIQASQQTQVQQQGATPTPVFPGDVPNPMNGN